MKKRPVEKMSVANRAKQFMPFSALDGLDDALARIEREIELDDETEFTVRHISNLPDSVISAQSQKSKEI